MHAVSVEQYGGPQVLTSMQLPDPEPGPGQVAIDVAYAGINYADVMARRDGYQVTALPFVPGLELSGRVRALGSGSEAFEVGQPVAAFVPAGAYAEIAVADTSNVYALPQGTNLREAACWLAVLPTAYALLHHVGRLIAGESVLVHSAAGGVGTAVGQLARAAGAAAVYGVVSSGQKATFALKYGYDRVFVGDQYAVALPEATGGLGVDLILDPVGGETLRENLGQLARFGRLVSYGNASAQEAWQLGPAELYPRALTVSGFSIRALSRQEPALLRQLTESAIRAAAAAGVETPITGEFALDDVSRAHQLMESRATTGKLVVRVAGD
jgi:NADPH2:quinone reductase